MDLSGTGTCNGEKVFRGLPYWFPDFREFIEAELGQMEPHGPHHPPGRALLACEKLFGINKKYWRKNQG